ncbi:MAG: hypothetical protein COB40_09290 [Marinosulfonomonas sp.]|nr:MAG: hypothetical protein COB40_09290 [Marinosulfonomonas sp.]
MLLAGLFSITRCSAPQIIKNSVVTIMFLQIPLAILVGAMLRTTIILDWVGPWFRAAIELAACSLGLIFFIALAVGSYEPLLEAWRIGEYEGEGAMRVPTYPVRAIVLAMAVLSASIFSWQIFRILSGQKTQFKAGSGKHPIRETGIWVPKLY